MKNFLIFLLIIISLQLMSLEQFAVNPLPMNDWTGTTDGMSTTESSLVRCLDSEDGWMMFDISIIPPGMIDVIEFQGFVNSTNHPNWTITPVSHNPLTSPAAVLYGDINDEAYDPLTSYLFRSEGPMYSSGWKSHILGNSANLDLEAAIPNGTFTIGIASRDNNPINWITFDGWSEFNSPTLLVSRYTHVIGSVFGIWTLAESPYIVDGDIWIDIGNHLFIESGVQVLFAGDFSFAVNGELEANAMIGDNILFAPQETDNIWQGITIGEQFGPIGFVELSRAIYENSINGLRINNGFAQILNSSIHLDSLIVRDSTKVGITINDESDALVDSCEITGYSTGIKISNTSGSLLTPTIMNSQITNTTESSRNDEIGISISGLAAPTVNECLIEDYPYGFKITGTGNSTAEDPVLTNCRVRNSTESSRDFTLITGLAIEDVINIEIDADSIIGYQTGVEFINNSTRAESTPVLTNCRVRNSTESSRDNEIGISISGLVAGEFDENYIEDYPYGFIHIGNGGSNTETPVLTNCRIRNSTESSRDVELITGIYLEDVLDYTIEADTIIGYATGIEMLNTTSRAESAPVLTNCRVRNSTESSRSGTTGINLSGHISASIDDCDTEEYHKGIDIFNDTGSTSTPTLTNSRVRNSTESSRNTFIGLEISGDVNCSISLNEFSNCDTTIIIDSVNATTEIDYNLITMDTLSSNTKAIIASDSDTLMIWNNTIYLFDTGLDLSSIDDCDFYNNIIWNTNDPIEETFSTLTVSYSCIEGGFTGTGNIDEYPSFVDSTNDDFHLTWNSPCIDTGNPSSPLDDDGTTVDMGVYYFHQAGTPNIPANVTISIVGDSIEIEWDEPDYAISFSVYSSEDPYESVSSWTLEESDIRSTSWSEEISDDEKFYYIIGVNGIPDTMVSKQRK